MFIYRVAPERKRKLDEALELFIELQDQLIDEIIRGKGRRLVHPRENSRVWLRFFRDVGPCVVADFPELSIIFSGTVDERRYCARKFLEALEDRGALQKVWQLDLYQEIKYRKVSPERAQLIRYYRAAMENQMDIIVVEDPNSYARKLWIKIKFGLTQFHYWRKGRETLKKDTLTVIR